MWILKLTLKGKVEKLDSILILAWKRRIFRVRDV